jgi:uncharacterized OB-fold protein
MAVSVQELLAQIPLPQIQEWNQPFFEGGLFGELRLQRCRHCGELIYYPRIACPECLSMDYDWEVVSGRGTVYSFSFVWRPQHPAFLAKVPITVAAIRLDEGPMMISNIVHCEPQAVAIGMPVHVVFEQVAENIALPKFEPTPS